MYSKTIIHGDFRTAKLRAYNNDAIHDVGGVEWETAINVKEEASLTKLASLAVLALLEMS